MKKDIKSLIYKLDYNGSVDTQKNAIEELMKIDDNDVPLLFQPLDKRYWENAAKVLKAIGYPKNKLAIPYLFQWLKDMNWPGAWIALETLLNIQLPILLPYLENIVKCAIDENDEMWLLALKELTINRLKAKPSDFNDVSLFRFLEQL